MKIKQTGGIKKKRAGVTTKSVCFNCRKCFHSGIPHCIECKGIVRIVGNFFTRTSRKAPSLALGYQASKPLGLLSNHIEKYTYKLIKIIDFKQY